MYLSYVGSTGIEIVEWEVPTAGRETQMGTENLWGTKLLSDCCLEH